MKLLRVLVVVVALGAGTAHAQPNSGQIQAGASVMFRIVIKPSLKAQNCLAWSQGPAAQNQNAHRDRSACQVETKRVEVRRDVETQFDAQGAYEVHTVYML